MKYKRLGDLLLDAGVVSEEQIKDALAYGKEHHTRIGDSLIAMGAIDETQLIGTLRIQLGIEFVDLAKNPPSPDMVMVIPKHMAQKYEVVAISTTPDSVILAMADPLNYNALEDVKRYTRKKIVPVISHGEAVRRAVAKLYGNEGATRAIEEMRKDSSLVADTEAKFSTEVLDAENNEAQAPTIRLVNNIIERAVTENASDIHIEPQENGMLVRMRIDGMLRAILDVPKELQSSVISRIKIMGHMDISEHKIPLDGRANVKVKNKDVDLRINSLPTIYGEKIVIRLLDKTSQLKNKESIGMTAEDMEKYMRLISAHAGVILIVGPTGSGKSSTMQTMIQELNTETVNLITLEDPVEYNIPGVNQVQIDEKVGMTFASALRSVLRQDPDIIAVGEIRDGETAEIAMRSALTGHLVLSTIHTNDAFASLDRLNDIGVPAYLTATALNGIISQRLVRKVCPNCREAYEPSDEELRWVGMERTPHIKFYRGKGCPMCFDSGYRGRTAVFEILIINDELRTAIQKEATRAELQAVVKEGNFTSIADNCRKAVLEGTTTVDEVRRVIMGDI